MITFSSITNHIRLGSLNLPQIVYSVLFVFAAWVLYRTFLGYCDYQVSRKLPPLHVFWFKLSAMHLPPATIKLSSFRSLIKCTT